MTTKAYPLMITPLARRLTWLLLVAAVLSLGVARPALATPSATVLRMHVSPAPEWGQSLDLSGLLSVDGGLRSSHIVFDGDSLSGPTRYPSKLVPLLKGPWTTTFTGVPGQSTPAMLANAPQRVDPTWDGEQAGNVVMVWAGTNEGVGLGQATYDRLVAYCEARRAVGFKTVVFTVLPRSDPYGLSWGQPWIDGRHLVNDLLRANWASFSDALADVAADPRIGDDGDSEDAQYYADKVHLLPAGDEIVAQIARDALSTLTTLAVQTQASYDGIQWNALGDAAGVLTDDGYDIAGFADAPQGRRYYRLSFPGSSVYAPSLSEPVSVTPKVGLSAPTPVGSASAGRAFMLRGALLPRQAVASGSVVVKCYRRLRGGHWKLRQVVHARLGILEEEAFYTGRLTLPSRGNWRLRALYPQSDSYSRTVSPSSDVRVGQAGK
jgi:hypothetical protein